MTIGASLAGFTGYGFVLWMPTFLIRSYGLRPTKVGLVLALMSGVVGGLGTFTAGRLADVLARRDERWRTWLVAAAKAGYVPFLAVFFLVDDLTTALVLWIVPAFFGGFYLAPTFDLIQNLVSLRMRALASSIVLFILNIIGLGFGPARRHHVGSLRAALPPGVAVHGTPRADVWCAYHYYRAGRTLRDDHNAMHGVAPMRDAA